MDYGLEHIHAELMEVLADVTRVLDQNNLPYSLICGTLLGAVRHQGFIPWDDDVDLVLPRTSYDTFEALYPSQCGLGFGLDLSDTWVPRARKVGGETFVDLFVLDSLPQKRMPRLWKLLRLRVLQGMLKENTDYSRFSFGKRILLHATKLLGMPFSKESKLRAYRRLARTGGASRQVHMSNGAFSLLNMAFDADIFHSTTIVPFGGLGVQIPHNADTVLRKLYGDTYMTPPPENERKPLHLDR